MSKISMEQKHLEDVIEATTTIGCLAVAVEALRDHGAVMGVPCDDLLSSFDEWIDKVRSVVTASMEGLEQ